MEIVTATELVQLEFVEPNKRIVKMQNKARIYKSGGLHFSKSINSLVKEITGQDAEKLGKLNIPTLIAFDKGEPIKKTIFIAFEKDGKFRMNYTMNTKSKKNNLCGSFRARAIEITSRIPFNGKKSISANVEAWKQNTLQGLKITIEE